MTGGAEDGNLPGHPDARGELGRNVPARCPARRRPGAARVDPGPLEQPAVPVARLGAQHRRRPGDRPLGAALARQPERPQVGHQQRGRPSGGLQPADGLAEPEHRGDRLRQHTGAGEEILCGHRLQHPLARGAVGRAIVAGQLEQPTVRIHEPVVHPPGAHRDTCGRVSPIAACGEARQGGVEEAFDVPAQTVVRLHRTIGEAMDLANLQAARARAGRRSRDRSSRRGPLRGNAPAHTAVYAPSMRML